MLCTLYVYFINKKNILKEVIMFNNRSFSIESINCPYK